MICVVELWKVNRKRAADFAPMYRSWYGNFPLVHLLKPEHIEVSNLKFTLKYVTV